MRPIATITLLLFSACGVVDSDDNSTVVIGPDSATGGDIQLNDSGTSDSQAAATGDAVGDTAGDPGSTDAKPDSSPVGDAGGITDGGSTPDSGAASDGQATTDSAASADGGSDPSTKDTDGDGVPDVVEAFIGTDPNKADTDGDGLTDGQELGKKGDADPTTKTDPLKADSDGDGLTDGEEDANHDGKADPGESDPNKVDTDGDGLTDKQEAELGTDPTSADTDKDGLPDAVEVGGVGDADPASKTDPTKADTDGDGVPDGTEDANKNGKADAGEADPNDKADKGQPPAAADKHCKACVNDLDCGAGLSCEKSSTPIWPTNASLYVCKNKADKDYAAPDCLAECEQSNSCFYSGLCGLFPVGTGLGNVFATCGATVDGCAKSEACKTVGKCSAAVAEATKDWKYPQFECVKGQPAPVDMHCKECVNDLDCGAGLSCEETSVPAPKGGTFYVCKNKEDKGFPSPDCPAECIKSQGCTDDGKCELEAQGAYLGCHANAEGCLASKACSKSGKCHAPKVQPPGNGWGCLPLSAADCQQSEDCKTEGKCTLGTTPGAGNIPACVKADDLCKGKNCDDGNPCTTDTCEAKEGKCEYVAVAYEACCKTLGGKAGGACLHTDKSGQVWGLVPAGTFQMGCNAALDPECYPREKPQHAVTITAPFWLGVHEVTVEDYALCVAGGACSKPASSSKLCNASVPGREKHPVDCVSWQKALSYCLWLGGDLPTEAQWELAARGRCDENGGASKCPASMRVYPWGNAPSVCGQHAVYAADGDKPGCGKQTTWQVGTGATLGAGPYGHRDLLGNVWELVWDYFDVAFYATAAATAPNPKNTKVSAERVMRGGSYYNAPNGLRSGYRQNVAPASSASGIGFRCARTYQ